MRRKTRRSRNRGRGGEDGRIEKKRRKVAREGTGAAGGRLKQELDARH